ncbi:hypothetical protein CUN31_01780 [Enterococcus faecalis]|uniref:DUF5677 domain-containing protein n=1 Tax=Enterococcus faecalis TaxID=1351 RepID=UPI0001B2E936|nr:DUF5677 domain-containing protein [Enterococcus faecalis]EEU80238.1 conserved hypothetical protein [Enterococcus faecalis Fly1]EGO2630481.1 hypothetical protein [Enterococcus faecalis]EGO7618604.1 hypothetical protein [Enterococcus faecalis]EGO7913772.1 hypothetical protein [Enterococcus faecalis]EHZ2968574.1 hypothetical protein [Enterococcus faecalis]
MSTQIISYKEIFELTIRRLNRLKEISIKKNNILTKEDEFLFLLMGNMNLRLNTIFLLLEHNNTDGVLPLQRTIFELNLAFQVYINSDDKEKFLSLYSAKRNFESAVKWDKLMASDSNQLFSAREKEAINDFKNNYMNEVKNYTKMQPFKLWYELASNQSLKQLSDEYFNDLDYFVNYDEPSNWVHPQRLEKNLTTDLKAYLPDEYKQLLIGTLYWNLRYLSKNIEYIAKHLNICTSPPLVAYGKKVELFSNSLINLFKTSSNNK